MKQEKEMEVEFTPYMRQLEKSIKLNKPTVIQGKPPERQL